MKALYKNLIGVAVVVAAVAITAAISYNSGASRGADENTNLRDSVKFLLDERKEAYVVKRVSEQMSQIADQQRKNAEDERGRAEEQAKLAEQQADLARQNEAAARKAEGEAIAAKQEAENEKARAEQARLEALEQRDQATHAKAITDTVNFRALGRTLGNTSNTSKDAKQDVLAGQLAYASWYFLDKYKGNTYVSESFKALVRSGNQMLQTRLTSSQLDIKLSTVKGEAGKCVAATSYGELFLLSRSDDGKAVQSELIIRNTKYDFHDVLADRNVIYAVSANGPLCVADYKGSVKEMPLPKDIYVKILKADARHLLILGKKSVSWYDLQSGAVVRSVNYAQKLSSLSTAESKRDVVCLFFDNGTFAEMDSDGKITQKSSPIEAVAKAKGKSMIVTAAHYDAKTNCLSVGTKDGTVYPLNYDYRVMEVLSAHTGSCSGISMVGTSIVTTGYDKSVYIWSMDHLMYDSGLNFWEELKTPRNFTGKVVKPNVIPTEWLVPVNYAYSSWTLSVCADEDGKSVWYATAIGNIRNLNVSVDDMADIIYRKFDCNMKESDWKRYVGVTVPYIKFR